MTQLLTHPLTHPLPLPKLNIRIQQLWVLALVFTLISALIFSVFLGQLHAVKHAGFLGAAHAESMHTPQHDKEHVNPHGNSKDHGFYEQLFSNHSTDTDCRLYDQLSDGHAMPVVAVALLPGVLPSPVVASFAGEALARWAALFDARGPPLTF